MSSSYKNITLEIARPSENYIAANWVFSKDTNFFKKQVLSRGGYLLLTPWSTITRVADVVIGVGAGIASIATGGMHKATFTFAMNHLGSSCNIVARPYVNLLKTLNPDAKFSQENHLRYQGMEVSHAAMISDTGNGFITHYVAHFLNNVAGSCCDSNNFFKRHIASRLTCVLLTISLVVTRVVDGIIGVIAAVLSFLTLGKVESINNLAYRALQVPGIVGDLFYYTIKLINPWAGSSSRYCQKLCFGY